MVVTYWTFRHTSDGIGTVTNYIADVTAFGPAIG